MREIIFRGIDIKTREWVCGYYVCLNGRAHRIYSGYAETDCGNYYPDCHLVVPKTVGQYTGLTDKNGTKIFEGDIVKFGISQRIMYVHWNEETLTWELTDMGVSACEVNHLLNTVDLAEIQVESAYGEVFSEVIGNIHDSEAANEYKDN